MTAESRARLRDQLIGEEWIRTQLYFDSRGVPTIGVGRNLRDKGLSPLEVLYLLDNDIRDATVIAARVFPLLDLLDDVRQRALIDLAFNLGEDGLRSFKRMGAAIKVLDWETAAAELEDSAWWHQVQPARRERLQRMLRTGIDA